MGIRKLSPSDCKDIAALYRDELIPMKQIAAQYNISRMAIYKVLKRMGVNTTKATAAHISTVCTHCGKPTSQVRCIFRKTRHAFCSRACFYAWLNRSITPFISHRHGLRIARKVVSKYFTLSPDNIVHHEDRDEGNNEISNLKVFFNQADHIRYHRNFNISPIFEGSTVPPAK